MAYLTLIGDSSQLDVYVAVDTLNDEPQNEITRGLSINGVGQSHERYEKPSYRFSTNHMTKAEVDELEDFLIANSNTVEVEGLFEGTFDVVIESSRYVFFYKDGLAQITGQVLEITATQIPEDKWVGEES